MRPKPEFPPETPGVPRISHSRYTTYLKCGQKALFDLEGRQRRVSVPLVRGGAVDAAATHDDLEKVERGRPAQIHELIEVAAADYEETFAEEDTHESALEIAKGLDETVSATRVYAIRVSPATDPIPGLVQEPIVADLGGIELSGVPDKVFEWGPDKRPVPDDLKVGRRRNKADAQTSRQLLSYGLLVQARLGKLPLNAVFDSLYPVKDSWRHQRVWANFSRLDYENHIRLIRRVQQGIDAGVFLPAPEGAWWCSRKWCEYHTDCPFAQRR